LKREFRQKSFEKRVLKRELIQNGIRQKSFEKRVLKKMESEECVLKLISDKRV